MAGESVFDTTSNTTTEVVQKRYGEEAGEVSKKSFGVASDVFKTANNFGNMGVRALARHAGNDNSHVILISFDTNNEVILLVKHYFIRQENGVMKEVSADQAPKYVVESQL